MKATCKGFILAMISSILSFQTQLRLVTLSAILCCVAGCYAPLVSRGIPATTLPEEFRTPYRTGGSPLNLSTLTMTPQRDYLLGPNDILEVTVPGLYEQAEIRPIRSQVMADGTINLPLISSVAVQGYNLVQAQRTIEDAYGSGFIVEPRVSVALAEKSTTSVLVLGQVKEPGTYELPKYENDVGHALGAAFGLTEDAGDYIEIHRQLRAEHAAITPQHVHGRRSSATLPPHKFRRLPPISRLVSQNDSRHQALPQPTPQIVQNTLPQILRIPLRGLQGATLNSSDIVLGPGDVVVVPDRRHEVFYVVGALSTANTVRFTVGNRERELGVGFVLPRDREIDVVTAVAMAGYIDPIYSPTTVTVHRVRAGCQPMLIRVDLIKARYDYRETILVQPGDIIYLNPDHEWWWRRFIDRTLVEGFQAPYSKLWR
ncbi:MAG: polysaccharide biosynthesis/export family protein [Planctomycetes bacterium]|nr:polysaccharide biosynthesis/export family protein [Planctomycetota bacterium]